ncbi:MAG: sugar nucleotide-binding protein [Bdellovibrionota bacterium]
MTGTKAVLIVGGSGFLGTRIALRLRDKYKVFATYYKHRVSIPGITMLPFNVDNRNWVKRTMMVARPDVIIYAMGNHDSYWAEKNARFAERHHTSGAATVATASDMIQPKLIYLSSAYLFDGSRGNYHEGDTVLPNSVLGRAKLGGENIVKSKSLNYLILRTSPIFGRGNGINLSQLDKLRMALDRGERVELQTNELHSFAGAEGFCDVIERLVETGIRNKILHYSGLTKVTYYEWGKEFAKRFGYDPSLILPKKAVLRKSATNLTEEYIPDYSLNCTATIDALKIKPLLLEESFDLLQKQLIPRF